jgi:Tol biopolymer transport system component
MMHMAFKFLIIFAAPFLYWSAASGEEILYARYPALSPDGKTIAFTYGGDIWTVPSSGGEARRLTVHEAEDIRPQFSPDGKMILFSSRRFNNFDVFVMPADGGPPRQLTVHSASDMGTGWFSGSDSILFTSSRDGWRDIFKVAIAGGMPIKLTGYAYEQEYNGRVSPDGRFLLYNSGSGLSRWWRRDLRASRNADIYLQDRTKKPFTSVRLTNYPNHDVWPVWNQETGEIYFVSCRGDWPQIWKIPDSGGTLTVLTDFTDDGVQWLNSNPQGTILVFEQGFHIWLMDPSRNVLRQVPVNIKSDEKFNFTTRKIFDRGVQWFSLSPDEKKIAAVIHGEIFILPAEEPKEGKRVTFTSAREHYPAWATDSRTVYYCSDRDGNYEIYSADVVSGKETRLTDSNEDDIKPVVSPDGKYLAFYRGVDKIIRYDLTSNKETEWITQTLADLPVEPTVDYDWAPDSRWLVFSLAGPTYETGIYLANLDNDIHNISKLAGWNHRPRFSEDGKLVYFTARFDYMATTYKIDLEERPVEFFESSLDSLFLEEPEETGEEEKREPEPVKVDLRRIESRCVKAFDLGVSSEQPVLSADGKKYYFIASILGEPEIWSVDTENDNELKQLTHSKKGKTHLVLAAEPNFLLFIEDGIIKRLNLDDEKLTALTFKAVMDIDILENNRQKFNETWQMLSNYFYDPNFHGADWESVRVKYEPLLPHIRTEREFRDAVFEMMGELRASHLYIYSREPNPDEGVLTGELGLEFDYGVIEREGLFKVKNVLTDSPADIAGIRPGQYIKNISAVPVTKEINIQSHLAGTQGRRLSVVVGDKPEDKGIELMLKPVSRSKILDRLYDDWVEQRRLMVDSLSGGRLGYIHIRRMWKRYLDQFQHDLVSIAEPKEGLIIDVRNNGGGSIAVHLLGILMKSPYIMRNFCGLPVTSENKLRSKAYEKPMALLINNYSGSNSEIFSEGFRKLNLGKIIGEPTSGGVIGTAEYYLIDGTQIRRPSLGAYTTDMEDTELYPRKPDIFVENLPDDFINRRDPQLVRAVEELMKELK